MNSTKDLFIVLADVVASRQIKDRKTFDQRMDAAVKGLNQKFEAAMKLPIRAWKGLDEVAAVINSVQPLYALADGLNTLLAPDKIRMVVVKGKLDIIPDNGDVTQADGPGFHKAAAMMNQLKKEGMLFSVESGNPEMDLQLKLNVNLLLLLKETWTAKQRIVYEAYRSGANQEEIARNLGVTQQSISKTLKAIKAYQVETMEKDLQQWLETK